MQVAFYFAGETTQVLDAIPWVRCASGNVYIVYFHSALSKRASVQKSADWVKIHNVNIARGTTDPGYWLFNLIYISS